MQYNASVSLLLENIEIPSLLGNRIVMTCLMCNVASGSVNVISFARTLFLCATLGHLTCVNISAFKTIKGVRV